MIAIAPSTVFYVVLGALAVSAIVALFCGRTIALGDPDRGTSFISDQWEPPALEVVPADAAELDDQVTADTRRTLERWWAP